ncbi:MAG: phosphatidylglycerophosphatase A [Bacteriovoracia bacterium]
MKDQKIEGPSWPLMLFLSWFYTGKFPKAPGTVGSLATVPLIFLLHYLQINIYSLIGVILALTATAILTTEYVQKKYHLHDPQWIVIDEVIGMLITWSFVLSLNPISLIVVFVTFRFFDIIKIWPASYFDRIEHGSGTIIDDVISGLYAGIISFFIQKFL